MTILYFH